MAITITRTAWTDDDGTGTIGSVINNAVKTELYGQIDAALALLFPLAGGVPLVATTGAFSSTLEVTGAATFGSTMAVTGDIYTAAMANYGGTSTIVGWTTPSAVIMYKKIGKLVFVSFRISGTSNSTSVTFTLPYASANNGLTTSFTLGSTSDNSASAPRGSGTLPANSSTVTCATTADGAWTASGTKIVGGQFCYEAAA